MHGVTGYVEEPIQVPPWLNYCTHFVKKQVLQIINRALTLNYQLKKRDLISTDLVITGGIIDGDARRARLYLKNWPARIVYDELDALFLDLARNETDKVPVRASVEVTSPINGKQATVPQLFIELADLTADSADAAQRAKRARLRDTPKDTTDRLLASDIETLTSALQHDADDLDNARRIVGLVRSFHGTYNQPTLVLLDGADPYKIELRFTNWTEEMQYSQLQALKELNPTLKRPPILLELLHFNWSTALDQCYLSVTVQKCTGLLTFRLDKQDDGKARWRPSEPPVYAFQPDVGRLLDKTRPVGRTPAVKSESVTT